MDKYGVMPDSLRCDVCHGSGQKKIGRRHWIFCLACDGTGRKTAHVDPVKEANELKKEIRTDEKREKR